MVENNSPQASSGRQGRGGGRTSGRGRGRSVGQAVSSDQKNSSEQHQSKPKRGGGGRGGGRHGGGRGRGRGGRGRGGAKTTKGKAENQSQKKENDQSASKPDEKEKRKTAEKQPNQPKKPQQGKGKVGQQKKITESSGTAKKKEGNQQKQKDAGKGKDKSKSNGPASPSIPPSQSQQTSDINYGRGEIITILHVAEKPSIAQAIAKGLSRDGNVNFRNKSLPVHEFSGPPFPKAPHASSVKHRVTSVAGHVFNVDFPDKFQSWDSVDPAELFDAPIVRKPCKGSVVKHLQDEGRNVNFIVLWMDCDREGENINFEVLDCCMHLMKSGGGGSNFDRVYRAYFSAINPSDIQKAYQVLGKPDKNQALSVDARQELDLKIGIAFSRFQTRFFQGRYGDLNSAVLSYGPCQTPTLGFCAQRHVDIETFKPEPYWVLELGINKRGRSLRALWDSGRSFNKGHVESLVAKALEASPVATVSKVVTKDKKQGRPVPLNTVALLKACSKALGIGPHHAMQTAERLYLSGYLSYPRTESSTYPKSFDIRGTMEQQTSDNRWGRYCRDLLKSGSPLKARGGVDMGDHPPITPCRATRAGELSGDLARVYDFVVRHFIASVSQDAVWRSTRIDFDVEALDDKGKFTLRGKEPVSPGFLAILLHKEYGEEKIEDDDEDEEERTLPEFKEGETIPLMNSGAKTGSEKVSLASGLAVRGNLAVKEKVTTPPTYLSESELIALMERNAIGTDSSIATHIENIQKRNYTTLESGRRLVPSKLGLVLAQGYHAIDSSLVLPRVRSDIEGECNKISKGLATKDVVVRDAIELFRKKFDVFVANISKMDILFGSSFAKLEDVGKPFIRCGISRRYLQLIEGPPPRLYNKWTETVYPLPSGGMIKQWTGRMCNVPECNFELCLYSVGNPPRTFPLCPRCYNDIDWALDQDNIPTDKVDREDEEKERQIKSVAGKKLVLECPLPDWHPLIKEWTVSPDPDSGGSMILDPHMGPKWRLVSTRDPTIIYLPQIIDKIRILDKQDEVLGIHLMQITFKDGQSPLPDGATKYTSCFPTDTVIQDKVRVYHGSDRLKASGRGGRGRGRGRGRAGRGRGRGRR